MDKRPTQLLNRRAQLLLPPALKVAKWDFEPRIDEKLANDQGWCDSRGVLFLSWASCSAIRGSKSDFATFNAGGKSNWERLISECRRVMNYKSQPLDLLPLGQRKIGYLGDF